MEKRERDIIELRSSQERSRATNEYQLRVLGLGEPGFPENKKFIYRHHGGGVFRDAVIERIHKDFSVDIGFGNSGHALFASPSRLEVQSD